MAADDTSYVSQAFLHIYTRPLAKSSHDRSAEDLVPEEDDQDIAAGEEVDQQWIDEVAAILEEEEGEVIIMIGELDEDDRREGRAMLTKVRGHSIVSNVRH